MLSDEDVLAQLETDLELDYDGDPIKGIAIAVLLGMVLWTVAIAFFVQLP